MIQFKHTTGELGSLRAGHLRVEKYFLRSLVKIGPSDVEIFSSSFSPPLFLSLSLSLVTCFDSSNNHTRQLNLTWQVTSPGLGELSDSNYHSERQKSNALTKSCCYSIIDPLVFISSFSLFTFFVSSLPLVSNSNVSLLISMRIGNYCDFINFFLSQ